MRCAIFEFKPGARPSKTKKLVNDGDVFPLPIGHKFHPKGFKIR
ncbi:hypothetical protein CCC_01615 [Paramagnetospirillum magnetotacticum MS-1]|uniref:Uncharacterized protein n=1 Tax=Paramagnetospirillum magnetotacticum MS-1 TaxID=272627 RepID=A0A0C2YAI0_PARME|nr:hypothetical protein CCC_01615 [Paramagnetospirillum magnetotacticum MS-1]